MSTVVFVSHPLGDRIDDIQRWHDNLANAGDWIRFVIETTNWVVLAPWYVYAMVSATDGIMAGRRLVDSLTAMERSDVVLMLGGYFSPHMRDYDAKTARRLGLPVVDLTWMGVTPPDKSDEDAVQLMLARVHGAIVKQPRRVWMPLLTASDLDALKTARHFLYTSSMREKNEFDVAVAVLDRIIQAASDRGA